MPGRAPARSVRAVSTREAELLARLAAREQDLSDQQVRAKELERALGEALEQQTADVLRAISRSPSDVQSVLHTIAASALRLTRSHRSWIYQVEGESRRTLAAAHSRPFPPEQPERSHVAGMLRDRGFATARALIEQRTVQVPDVLAAADVFPSAPDSPGSPATGRR
jgi:hypothetical protein